MKKELTYANSQQTEQRQSSKQINVLFNSHEIQHESLTTHKHIIIITNG